MTPRLDLPQDLRSRRQYGVFSDFLDRPVRQRFSYRAAALWAGADLAATSFFSPVEDVILRKVAIHPDGSSAGVDDSNTSTWSLFAGATLLASQTFDDATPFPAGGVQFTLPLADRTIPAGQPIKVSIANGTSAATPATLVSIEYENAVGWPEAAWKSVASDGGAPTLADEDGGSVLLSTSDSSPAQEDEAYFGSARPLFRLSAGKPIVSEVRLQFTEDDASAHSADVVFGLSSSLAANLLRDSGAGPPASYTGAVLFKPRGGSAWRAQTSVGSVQTTTVGSASAGGAAEQVLRVEVVPHSPSEASVTYRVDGATLRDLQGREIRHFVSLAGASPMHLVVGVKAGSAAGEALSIDYLGAWQLR